MNKNNINTNANSILYNPDSGFEGLSQYRQPLCHELTGKFFKICLDSKKTCSILLKDDTKLVFFDDILSPKTCSYECLKCVEGIYLIHFVPDDNSPRKAVTIVLDNKNSLATVNFAVQGNDTSFPALVERKIHFGYIETKESTPNKKRHSYTEDLVGKKIEYTYNPMFSIIHIYHSKNTCRAATPSSMKERNMFSIGGNKKFEEPCVYIKIDEDIYVFSWIEENLRTGTQGFMLMNTKRLTDVGVFFGTNPQDNPESYTVSAYGRFINDKLDEEL